MAHASTSVFNFIARARDSAGLLRLRPFDTSTEDGRSRERHRRIALTALASIAAKAVSVLTGLISVPLTYDYLGTERYGVWMTISSIIVMLSFADLGIGSGLLNFVSAAHGKKDSASARQYVSSAFFMLLGIALVLGAVFYFLFPWLHWQRIFNLKSPAYVGEVSQAVVVFAACFLLNLPLSVVTRVQLGLQRGFVNHLWSASGNVLALVCVLAGIFFHAPLPWLVLAMAGAPIFVLLLNGIVLFGWHEKALRPNWLNARLSSIATLIRAGAVFFVVQLSITFAVSSDNLVIAQVLDQDAVAQYSIVAKMFGIIPMLMEMFLGPLWPAYAESISRGDVGWVRRTLLRSLVFASFFGGSAALVLILFGNPILHFWVGPSVHAPLILLFGFGIWSLFSVAGNALAMFLNGTNAIKFQALCASATAITAIAAKIILASRFGLPGIIWGTVIAYLVFVALPMVFYVPRRLKKMQTAPRLAAADCD